MLVQLLVPHGYFVLGWHLDLLVVQQFLVQRVELLLGDETAHLVVLVRNWVHLQGLRKVLKSKLLLSGITLAVSVAVCSLVVVCVL